MAWAQKDRSRGICRVSIPTRALNHCRSSSTRLTAEIGTPQRWVGESGDVVVDFFGFGVQDPVAVQGFQPRLFILGQSRSHYELL